MTAVARVIDRRAAEAAGQLAAAKEQYLLDYFGSREMIERNGDDYVFEEWPVEVFDASSGWDGESGAVSFRQKFRLRRKTQEEKDAEHAGYDDWETMQAEADALRERLNTQPEEEK